MAHRDERCRSAFRLVPTLANFAPRGCSSSHTLKGRSGSKPVLAISLDPEHAAAASGSYWVHPSVAKSGETMLSAPFCLSRCGERDNIRSRRIAGHKLLNERAP